jgi:hypothetical protein
MQSWSKITHYAGFDWAHDHHEVVIECGAADLLLIYDAPKQIKNRRLLCLCTNHFVRREVGFRSRAGDEAFDDVADTLLDGIALFIVQRQSLLWSINL